MTLSRRDFLRIFGGSAAAAVGGFALAFSPTGPTASDADLKSFQARALHTAPVREMPSPESPVVKYLWEDEIFDVQAAVGRWMQSSEGFIAAHDAQPMLVTALLEMHDTPHWAAVVGAAAAVRAWACDSAPLIEKIGHGGVMRVLDRLAPRAACDAWVAIADEHDRVIGWSRNTLWSAIGWRTTADADLIVDAALRRAELWEAGAARLCADVALGRALVPGEYPVTLYQPGTTIEAAGHTRLGVPYVQRAGNELSLGGVYWHNQFGAALDGLDIQLPVQIARAWFGRLRRVIVR
ncbi:MAG: hypothetical protein JNL42_17940 [Anaerolineae bacterium]|nr:hypothetical protein [Anaerolineae bacterium]